MAKMNKEEFITKCQAMISGLAGLGFPCQVAHDTEPTFFKFQPMNRQPPIYIYNSEKEPVWCHKLDFGVRLKESDEFLEVS